MSQSLWLNPTGYDKAGSSGDAVHTVQPSGHRAVEKDGEKTWRDKLICLARQGPCSPCSPLNLWCVAQFLAWSRLLGNIGAEQRNESLPHLHPRDTVRSNEIKCMKVFCES